MRRYIIYVLPIAMFAASIAGCSKKESTPDPGKQHVGSQNNPNVPEGYFVATFSAAASTRAEPDFGVVTGEDERVFDLRYLIYDDAGNFVRERLIFDDFDEDTDDTQDWPLEAPGGDHRHVAGGPLQGGFCHQHRPRHFSERQRQHIHAPAARSADGL